MEESPARISRLFPFSPMRGGCPHDGYLLELQFVAGGMRPSNTPVAGSIPGHFPEAQTLNLISRTAISPDFASFFK